MKFIPACLFIFILSTSGFAKDVCKEFNLAGKLATPADAIANEIEFYKETNKKLHDFSQTTCEISIDYADIISAYNRMCNSACLDYKQPTKNFLKDCKSSCDQVRKNQNAAKDVLVKAQKDADVEKAKKNNISDLKREAKELGLDIDSAPAGNQKSKSVQSK